MYAYFYSARGVIRGTSWPLFSYRHVQLKTHFLGGGCIYVFMALMYVTYSSLYLNQAFDQHLNLVLGDVEESVTVVEVSSKAGH